MPKFVRLDSVEDALVEAGQSSTRYKIGETWELNAEEIRNALSKVDAECFDLNEVLKDMVNIEREVDYWHEKCDSYEMTIVHLTQAINELGSVLSKKSPK